MTASHVIAASGLTRVIVTTPARVSSHAAMKLHPPRINGCFLRGLGGNIIATAITRGRRTTLRGNSTMTRLTVPETRWSKNPEWLTVPSYVAWVYNSLGSQRKQVCGHIQERILNTFY